MHHKDMRKKFRILSACSFVLAIAIFLFTFYIYHHLTPEMTFVSERLDVPGKPFVTLLFGIWGTCFLFASVMCLLISSVFFGNKKEK